MTNHQDGKTFFAHLDYFQVHFGHQWTSGVVNLQATGFGIAPHFLRNAMGTEYDNSTARHFFQFLDKYRALGTKLIYNIFVVDDFMAHVNGLTKAAQGLIHNIDRAINARAKSPGLGEQNFRLIDLAHGASHNSYDFCFKGNRLASQGVIEIKPRTLLCDRLQDTRILCAARGIELNHVSRRKADGLAIIFF